jgi:hypothetical protein
MHTRARVLAASILVAALFICVPHASAQQKPAPKVDKAAMAEQAAAVKMMDDVLGGQPAPTDFTFTFANHMMKSGGNKMFVPFVITFDKGKRLPANATYYLRVVNKAGGDMQKVLAAHKAALEKAAASARFDPENIELADQEAKLRAQGPKVEYAFEDLRLGQTFQAPPNGGEARFASALVAPAGDFDVYVLFKEPTNQKDKKAQPKAGVLKVPVTVPNLWTDDLATSTVFVTNQAESLKTPPTQEDILRYPYIFGMMRIVPALDPMPKFAKKDELSIVFYIYNTGLDKTTNKPNLSIEYNFYHKENGAEKFFNRTDPQVLNESTLGPNFDVKAGHQLLGGQGIPLASFPEGEYRLEIKVNDKVSGKSKVENASFTIVAG